MKADQLRDDEPVIVDALRTPVGRRNGALKDIHAADLLGRVLTGLVQRNGLPPEAIGEVVAGCATAVGEQAGNVARVAVLSAGLPVTVPGMVVQRACGSSQQAVHVADNMIRAGAADVVIAGGIELMSRTQGANDDTKYGRRHPEWLVEKFAMPSMGEAAERIADRWDLPRTWLDELSLRSHALAAAAQDSGAYDGQMLPIVLPNGETLAVDEGVRRGGTLEKLASLTPAFRPEGGRITAGNASQVSDGAAGLLLMTARKAREFGLRPRARLVAQLAVGVEPEIMLTGPIPATRAILARSGLSLRDIDLFEINEAFASVHGAWIREFDADLDRVNVTGGSIAIGHPLGSTGARLMTQLVCALEQRGGRYGLQSMCCAGGLGTATIVERIE